MSDPRLLLPQTTIPADFLGGLLDRWDHAMFQWQETFLHALAEHDWKLTHRPAEPSPSGPEEAS